MSSRVHKISTKYAEDCRPVYDRYRQRHRRQMRVTIERAAAIRKEAQRERQRSTEWHKVATKRSRSWHWAHLLFATNHYAPLCGAQGKMEPVPDSKLKECGACRREKDRVGD